MNIFLWNTSHNILCKRTKKSQNIDGSWLIGWWNNSWIYLLIYIYIYVHVFAGIVYIFALRPIYFVIEIDLTWLKKYHSSIR